MASTYPTALDTFLTLVDNVDTIAASDWNKLADCLVAIENSIGANLSLLQTTGELKIWSGSIELIPSGWLHCDGSAISRNTFASLYSAKFGPLYPTTKDGSILSFGGIPFLNHTLPAFDVLFIVQLFV